MRQALDGVPASTKAFLEAFLITEVFVPTRKQQHPLSDSPNYPNDFFELLAVKDKERTIIPTFSRMELIKEWCGNELLYRKVSTKNLIERTPEEWWLILNPGLEIEKEFSPWEISQLRLGTEGVSDIVSDLADESEPIEPEDVEAVSQNDSGLHQALKIFFEQNASIAQLYLLRASKEERVSLLIGLRLNAESDDDLEELRDKCQRVARKELIGAEDLKVLAALENQPELALGIFQEEHLLFERKRGFFSKFWR